jgi:hypothetical protein
MDNSIQDEAGESDETNARYRVTDSFLQALDRFIDGALESAAPEPEPSSLSPKVELDSSEARKYLAQLLRKEGLPSRRSTAGICIPLIIVTRNKFPVKDAWYMLTALPHGSSSHHAPEETSSGQRSGLLLSVSCKYAAAGLTGLAFGALLWGKAPGLIVGAVSGIAVTAAFARWRDS